MEKTQLFGIVGARPNPIKFTYQVQRPAIITLPPIARPSITPQPITQLINSIGSLSNQFKNENESRDRK
jgi:hypothetical protein